MSFTSSCPKCQKEVTVPDRIGAASLVRCPLCEAEFELREALALGPPALVVIEAKTDDGQPIVPVSELALAEAQPAAAGVTDDDHWTSGWAATDETATAEPAEAGGEDAVVFGEITGKLPPSEGDGTRIPPRLPGMEGGEPAQPLPRKRRRPRQEHPIRVLCGCVIFRVAGRRRGLLGPEPHRRSEERHGSYPSAVLQAHLSVLVLVDAVEVAHPAGGRGFQGGRHQRPAAGGRSQDGRGPRPHAAGGAQTEARR